MKNYEYKFEFNQIFEDCNYKKYIEFLKKNNIEIQSFVLYDVLDKNELEKFILMLKNWNVKDFNYNYCVDCLFKSSRIEMSSYLINNIEIFFDYYNMFETVELNIIKVSYNRFVLEFKIFIEDDIDTVLNCIIPEIEEYDDDRIKLPILNFKNLKNYFENNKEDFLIENLILLIIQIELLNIYKNRLNSYSTKYTIPSIINYKLPKDFNIKNILGFKNGCVDIFYENPRGSILFNNRNGNFSYFHKYAEYKTSETFSYIENNSVLIECKQGGHLAKGTDYIPNTYSFKDYLEDYHIDFYLFLFNDIEEKLLNDIEIKYRDKLDFKFDKNDFFKLKNMKKELSDLKYYRKTGDYFTFKSLTAEFYNVDISNSFKKNKNKKFFDKDIKSIYNTRINYLIEELYIIKEEEYKLFNEKLSKRAYIVTFICCIATIIGVMISMISVFR